MLWIDDVPHSVLGERRLLRALGIEIVSVPGSEEALSELERDNDFDLVITDVQRSGSSWQKIEPGVPVVDTRKQGKVLVVEKADGTTLHDILEGVYFVVAELRKHEDQSIRATPVVFYAAYSMDRLVKFTSMVPDVLVSNSVDGLLRNVVPTLADVRENPIKVPRAKEPTGI